MIFRDEAITVFKELMEKGYKQAKIYEGFYSKFTDRYRDYQIDSAFEMAAEENSFELDYLG